MAPIFFTLAQLTEVSADESLNYLTEDPVGRIVGGAIAIVIIALLLVIFFKTFRWAAARWKMLTGIAILLGLGYLGAMYLFDMGPIGWLIGGAVGLGLFLGFALFMTQGGSRR